MIFLNLNNYLSIFILISENFVILIINVYLIKYTFFIDLFKFYLEFKKVYFTKFNFTMFIALLLI